MEELRIVRGIPTDEELAAIVGVLFARAVPQPRPPQPQAQSHWVTLTRPGSRLRDGRPVRPGRDGWRASALPR
jgi:Acyl-CoA carboxylase epsilon subunit